MQDHLAPGGLRDAFAPKCAARSDGAEGVTMTEALSGTSPTALGTANEVTAATLLERLDIERVGISNRLAGNPKRRADLGQFFTPAGVAHFMAAMLRVPRPPKQLRLLDAGAGSGILTAAAVAELCARPTQARPDAVHATVWEIDERLFPDLTRTFDHCRRVCDGAGVRFTGTLSHENFIHAAADRIHNGWLFSSQEATRRFHVAILNPPYRKLRSESAERKVLSSVGIETSNLYSAFVWLALKLLEDGGELVAITPRSFMNGSYFRPFREALAKLLAFRRVHVYDARDTAFADDAVLQENVVFHGIRGGESGEVTITTSYGPADVGFAERTIDATELILPNDPALVLHVVPDGIDARIAKQMRILPDTLASLKVSVSTGRVVGFRTQDRLQVEAGTGDAPLIMPRHLAQGYVAWPDMAGSKPNALAVSEPDDDLLLPAGWYVLVHRFSAKEEKRRVVAALYDPARVDADWVAFDNKLNVLHGGNAGLTEDLAKGLVVFLNSTAIDAYFRQFSGHTQVNAADLRSLPFPAAADLERLGCHVRDTMPMQNEIDHLVREEIPTMKEGDDPIAVKRRVQGAEAVLKAIGAPKAQRNERSALTLLGLLDLAPSVPWSDSRAPRCGVTQLMDWMADNYGKQYAPNTRETIRKFTLHPFIDMGLVLLNPDNPERPPNSPKNVYQISSSALILLRSFETEAWDGYLAAYLAEGGNRLREKPRQMAYIPVTLPNGQVLELTAGGQNVLVKEVVEQFAPRFTPRGYVVYVGDTGEKHLLYDGEYLRGLGVEIDPHGKMPDVVIHHVERNWLVLIEAVTSHGPVNLLRHNQLKDLFAGSTAGLIFVTTFLDRAAMREYLPDIAWETEVWVADAPEHLIHFDGERFLGPYGSSK